MVAPRQVPCIHVWLMATILDNTKEQLHHPTKFCINTLLQRVQNLSLTYHSLPSKYLSSLQTLPQAISMYSLSPHYIFIVLQFTSTLTVNLRKHSCNFCFKQ